VTEDYLRAISRRTAVHCRRGASGVEVVIDGPSGSYQPGARRFEVVVHGMPAPASVLLDGTPLPAVAPDGVVAGWWRPTPSSVAVRLNDDSRPHKIGFQ
jgi:hypothetical protein